MTSQEIFFSFIVGIASGIVSSVLVTVFYRIKDGEKDRQTFFLAVNEYVGGLISISTDDMDAMSAFISSHQLPRIFKWIRLTKAENIVILELYERVSDLQDVLMGYYESTSEIYDQVLNNSISPEESIAALKEKYLPQIISARVFILGMRVKVQSLGNKELQKVIKRVQKNS